MMRVMVDSLNITVRHIHICQCVLMPISARKKSDGSHNYGYLYI